MKTLARILGTVTTLLGLVALTPLRSPLGSLLWRLKMRVSAWSPFLAAAGGLGALLGLLKRDLLAGSLGSAGAALLARYAARAAAPHDGFERAFGRGWEARIPPERRAQLLSRRWQPVVPDPPPAHWEPDVTFGTHAETGDPLLCDLWMPPEGVEPTGLGMVYLHGSGWHFMDKDTGTRHFFGHLAAQGHAVMDVAYTLAPQADMRAMLNDVRRAVGFLKTFGYEVGVDPKRVVLAGGSAGAHLALLAAYTAHHPDLQTPDVMADPSVRAVVAFYGVPDLADFHATMQRSYGRFLMGDTPLDRAVSGWMERLLKQQGTLPPGGHFVPGQEMVTRVLGGPPEKLPEEYALFSPITHVGPHCPPTLLLQGEHDFGGLAPGMRRLHAALRRAGVPSVYVEFPDTDHGFDLFYPKVSPAAQAALYDVQRFLALMA